jgi:hypothetical protein
MADAAEVKVKLIIDSNADKATGDVKKGLESVEHAAGGAGRKIDVSLKGNLASLKTVAGAALGGLAALAVAAGTALVGAGAGAIHEYMEASKQVKILAGTFTLLSTGPATFKEIKAYAADVKDDLTEMAIAIGTTDEALVQTFDDIISRGGKSIDQAMKLTSAMAMAGRAVPGGAEALGEAFRNIEMGIIRAKNPIVGMIAATHTLQGNAKQVAAKMQQMTPEKQMALAEQAIAKMGERMKSAPMTFGEAMTSMKTGVSKVLEDAGRPIVSAMQPAVILVRNMFEENRGMLDEIGKGFGEAIGQVVSVAGPVLRELFTVMRENTGEFKKTFDALYGPAKELFTYIYEHKESFAKTMGDILRMILTVANGLIRAIAFVRDAVVSIVGSIASVVPGLGDFIHEEKQEGTRKKMVSAIQGTTRVGAPSEQGVDYGALKKEFLEGSKDVNRDMALFDASWKRATDDHNALLASLAGAREASMNDDAAKYAAMFDTAAKAHDVGAQRYVLQFLEGNISMQNALIKAGPEIFQTGVEGFYEALSQAGNADMAKSIREGMTKGRLGELGKPEIHQTFTGAISIKQDFRDADPDRIVTMFRDDLASKAASRIGARGVGPFGI